MSAWRLLVRGLYNRGGGPLRIVQFNEGATSCPNAAMRYAEGLGLVTDMRQIKERGWPSTWQLTELGEAVCEGRAKVVRNSTRRGTGPTVARIIGATIDDITIERVMLAAGYQPGAEVTPEVLRAYSDRLAAEVRKSVMA